MTIKGSGASLMNFSGVKGSGASLQNISMVRRKTNDLKIEHSEMLHKKSEDLTNSDMSGGVVEGGIEENKDNKIASLSRLISAEESNLKASDLSESQDGASK